jgi:hypothetical protein
MSGKRQRAMRQRAMRQRAGREQAQRRPAAAPAATAGRRPEARTGERPRRDAALRRARIAKTVVVAGALLTMTMVMAFARITYAGHVKHASPPLVIPKPLYDVVRRNLLQAGILAPATAPSSVVTGSS